MIEPVYTLEVGEGESYKKIVIFYDEEPPYPRDHDGNIGTIVGWHRRVSMDENPSYSPGTWLLYQLHGAGLEEDTEEWDDFEWDLSHDSPDAINKAIEMLDDTWVFLPVYMLDHSGYRFSTSSAGFRAVDSVGWDWGQLGVIYTTRRNAADKLGWNDDDWSDERQEEVEGILRQEIKDLDDYHIGNVYCYVVYNQDGLQIDDGTGFLGHDPDQLAKDVADGKI